MKSIDEEVVEISHCDPKAERWCPDDKSNIFATNGRN
jgi:hypothetical protein